MINGQTGETICILDIEGDVDFSTSLQLKQDLMQAAERGVKQMIVNFSKVGYLDCAGLRVLISSLKRLRQVDGNLVLVGMGPRVRRIIEVTGATKIFDIYPTEEEATT